MKLLTIMQCPKPYDNKCIIVLEESFKDKEGQVINFVKPYVCPVAGIANVAIGDDVMILYNQWKKIDSVKKVVK